MLIKDSVHALINKPCIGRISFYLKFQVSKFGATVALSFRFVEFFQFGIPFANGNDRCCIYRFFNIYIKIVGIVFLYVMVKIIFQFSGVGVFDKVSQFFFVSIRFRRIV